MKLFLAIICSTFMLNLFASGDKNKESKTFNGKVKIANEKELAKNITVWVNGQKTTVKTNKKGEFQLKGLYNTQSIQINFSKNSEKLFDIPFIIFPSQDNDITFYLTR